jgi:glycerol-3-phosphate dehydrogenase
LRHKDGEVTLPAGSKPVRDMVAPSQGVHLVVDAEFLASDVALMVPKTADGRVLFAVPWLGKVILGTTDTPRHDLAREPQPFKDEVDFILEEAGRYLRKAPTRADVRSIWVGLRPLVKPQDDGATTKGLSREHTVLVSRSGLVTVTGGKWTTYRAMAEDVMERCIASGLVPAGRATDTAGMHLSGYEVDHQAVSMSQAQGLHAYGAEKDGVLAQTGANRELAPGLTEAMVRYAALYEYARTVEDVLARRHRVLFLDARLAATLAPEVGSLLREMTDQDPKTEEFLALTTQYLHWPE